MCGSFNLDKEIPKDLSSKVIIVTGANSGLGAEVTKVLATKGAELVLACRSEERATAAMESIKKEVPDANLTFLPLDLSDLAKVENFVKLVAEKYPKVDVLVNNAGLGQHRRKETADGFEFVMGVNHFGVYALTVRLLNAGVFDKAEKPRIVVTSSELHRKMFVGKPSMEDLDFKQGKYKGMAAYSLSKLANLLFAYKLKSLLDGAGKSIEVVTTHPGLTVTNLNNDSAFVRAIGMPLKKGAMSSIYASVSENAQSGDYIGPNGCFKITGYPQAYASSADSHSEPLQNELWDISKERTGVSLEL